MLGLPTMATEPWGRVLRPVHTRRPTLAVILLAVVTALAVETATATAATFAVNRVDDRTDVTPGDGQCTTAVGGCTLRAAIQEANALGGSHEIRLAAGRHALTLPGAGELWAATGDLNIRASITISGAGVYWTLPAGQFCCESGGTLIDANFAFDDRVFSVAEGFSLTLNGVSIWGGEPGAGSPCSGGAIRVDAADLILKVAHITSASACSGGAIAAGSDRIGAPPANVVLDDASFEHNAATSGVGGALSLGPGSTATIRRALFRTNTAAQAGGAIFMAGAALTVANTTVGENTAASGGAIETAGGSATTLVNVTIAGNSSSMNAAIVGAGTMSIANTIIADSRLTGNQPNSQDNCDAGPGVIVSEGHNLEFPGNTCGFNVASDVRADPRLGSFQKGRGYAFGPRHAAGVYPLLVDSPAIDAGGDQACGSSLIGKLDQRGLKRPFGAHCDVGAYEAPSVAFDFDGDRKGDFGIYRQATGQWFVLRSSDGGLLQAQWGAPHLDDKPVPGDYDGDGRTDVAVYRAMTGEWFIQGSRDPRLVQYQWGAATVDVPVPADYDGDGRHDVAVYRAATGEWFILRSGDGGTARLALGSPSLNDVPLPADYDGDGRADIAVYRPSTWNWTVRRSSDGGIRFLTWGSGDSVPVPADYDGDGEAEFTVFRKTTAEWWSWWPGPGIPCARCVQVPYVWGSVDPSLGDTPLPFAFNHQSLGSTRTIYRRSTGQWFIAPFSVPLSWGSADVALGDVPVNLPSVLR
jgi:CSLREA domain-containing protein